MHNVWKLEDVKSEKIALVLMNHCVNAGTGSSSRRRVQKALNNCGFKLKTDGVIGPKTMAALNKTGEDFFVIGFVKVIQEFYGTHCTKKQEPDSVPGWLAQAESYFA